MREPGLLGNDWPQVMIRLTDTWLQAVLRAVETMEDGGWREGGGKRSRQNQSEPKHSVTVLSAHIASV